MSLQYRSTSPNKEKVGIIFTMHVSLHGLTSYKSSWIIWNTRSISMWRNRYTDRRDPRHHLRLYFMFSLHLPVTESMQIANITGLTDEGPINVYILSQIRAFSNRWMNDSYYTIWFLERAFFRCTLFDILSITGQVPSTSIYLRDTFTAIICESGQQALKTRRRWINSTTVQSNHT